MKKILMITIMILFTTYAVAGDGIWDANKGGIDRDMDNDGVWDADKGGIDRDVDRPY